MLAHGKRQPHKPANMPTLDEHIELAKQAGLFTDTPMEVIETIKIKADNAKKLLFKEF